MDPSETDDFLWLEEIDGAEATEWVAAQNAKTLAALADARFESDQRELRSLFDAADRIPGIRQYGAQVYNFWTDAEHPRGLWRRTTLAAYRTDAPDWEILLDLDALGRAEGESWVWGGAARLPDSERVMVSLSRGGADAVVLREFDLERKSFVADGFTLPEAKSQAGWLDRDTLLIGTTLGGDATESGYPRRIQRWARGTKLAQAPVVFEVAKSDMIASFGIDYAAGHESVTFLRSATFFLSDVFYEPRGGARVQLDLPQDASVNIEYGRLLVRPRSPWEVAGRSWPAGALLMIDLADFLAGARDFTCLFEPAPRKALETWLSLPRAVLMTVLENVQTRLYLAEADRGWASQAVPHLPEASTISAGKLAPLDDTDETLLIGTGNFLTPYSYALLRLGSPPELLKQEPARFDATGLQVAQYAAAAADGTAIPYYFISPGETPPAGGWPVQLYGYGGFEVSLLPHYLPVEGRLWLTRGGAYALANIRGGGEFGPDWHRAGRREGKRVAQDDFAAVARDIAARGLAPAARILGAGGSNGGLLVGNMLTRHPDAFGAILCTVPLLDMQRYTKLFAGASWIDEYGDPDRPEDWAFLRGISPYHLARPGQSYPPALIMTTARDDRVHPGHARKMAAKLQALGYDALYFEQTEGGHGSGADAGQRAQFVALEYAFHRQTVGG